MRFWQIMMESLSVLGNQDYYCDAMNICGIKCVEIDLQEAKLRQIKCGAGETTVDNLDTSTMLWQLM